MRITKPRTQRKRLFQAPAHLRHKNFSAPLSPDLKQKHGTNALPVKTGDSVRVMRGDRQGFEGKITRVDRQGYRIFVEGVTREKVDGSAVPIPIHPSKVMLTNLDLSDKWRREALKRKGPPPKPATATVAVKPAQKKKGAHKPAEPKRTAKKERKPRKRKAEPTTSASKKTKKPRETRKPKARRRGKAKVKKGAE